MPAAPAEMIADVGVLFNSPGSSRGSPSCAEVGEAEGAVSWTAAVRAARARLLVPADGVHRRLRGAPDRPRGDLRPGAERADLPHPGRGSREGQQHAVRSQRGDLDRKGCRILWMADQLRAGVVWANAFNKFDPTSTISGCRSPVTAARAAGTVWRPILSSESKQLMQPRRRAQDLQALHRRGVPPLRVRPLIRGRRQQGQVPGERGASLPQGRARRRAGGPQGLRRLVRATPTTAARSSTGSRRFSRDGASSSSTRSSAARVSAAAGRDRRRRLGGPARLVRRLGRQDRPGGRRHQPGGRAVL